MIVFHFAYILVVRGKKATVMDLLKSPVLSPLLKICFLHYPARPSDLACRPRRRSRHNGTLYSRNLSAVGVTAGMATAGCQRILWWSAGPPSVEGEPGVWWHLAFYGKKLCIRVDIQPYA